MDWVKLDSTYYLDVAIVRAGEAAEVLFVRAMAYCGDQENDGLVEREILPRLCPTRWRARAAALVREGLWEVVPEGWRFASWSRHQRTREQMEAERVASRARKAKSRAGHAVTPAVTPPGVTQQRREEERRTAAAAADAAAAAPIDPTLDVFRAKIQAHTRLQALRFDTLVPSAAERLVRLIELHGDDRLVKVALDTCKATPPVHVSAFLGTWEALPAPGVRLAAVEQRFCPTHDWVRLSPAGVCTSCASERLAEGVNA